MEKYLIIGGCSYAHKDVEVIGDILGIQFQYINVNTPASSNRYISESIISTCDLLLKNGVPSKDILVINNFTQIGRANPVLSESLKNEVEKSLQKTENRSFKDISYYEFYNTFVSVVGRMYHLLIGYGGKSLSVKSWISKQEDYYFNTKNPISYFEDYLTDIILMQTYLKQKNISVISYLMNNVIDGWNDNLSHCYTNYTKWELPSTKEYKHISELSSLTKILWEMIDLDSIVFYETENNKYGGIDEYFIDIFKDREFLHDTSFDSHTFYGNHPGDEVYRKFTSELLKPKLQEWNRRNLL